MTEIADILNRNGRKLLPLPCFAIDADQLERPGRIQQIDGGMQAHLLILRITCFHNLLDLEGQFRIGFEPLLDLSAIEVLDGQVLILDHTLSQFLRRIGHQMPGGIEGNAEVLDDLIFFHRDVLALNGSQDLIVVPALGGVLDEQAPADPGKRIRHVHRDGNPPFHLVNRHGRLVCLEHFLTHPQGQDGHAQREEIRLGGQLRIVAIRERDGRRIDFRGRINRGSELLGHTTAVHIDLIGDAKITQDAVPNPAVLDKDIGRFHILMEDAGLMDHGQGHGGLGRNDQDGFGISLQPR